MKQKIVINVQMHCQKCRTKAMKIAVKEHGVTKVEVQGSEKDQLVVIGDGVDPVKLTCSLRKELRCATILSVGEEKENKGQDDKKADPIPIHVNFWESRPRCCCEVVVYEPNPSACSIM